MAIDPPDGVTIVAGATGRVRLTNTFINDPPPPPVTTSTTADTGDAPVSSPTISSDRADYHPGETVVLAGEHWTPGVTVHVVVNDDLGETWRHVANVTADESGSITDSFRLPNKFVATYRVTATRSPTASPRPRRSPDSRDAPPSITVTKEVKPSRPPPTRPPPSSLISC